MECNPFHGIPKVFRLPKPWIWDRRSMAMAVTSVVVPSRAISSSYLLAFVFLGVTSRKLFTCSSKAQTAGAVACSTFCVDLTGASRSVRASITQGRGAVSQRMKSRLFRCPVLPNTHLSKLCAGVGKALDPALRSPEIEGQTQRPHGIAIS